jgi:hypothetical protein
MRRKFLGWMTAAVLSGCLLAGCGSGGGDASSFHYVPPPGPMPPPQRPVSFRIPAYNAGDQAVLVFTPVSKDEFDQSGNTIQINAVNARQSECAEDHSHAKGTFADKCGLNESIRSFDERVGLERVRERSELLRPREIQPRWDGLPKGTPGELFHPLADKVDSKIEVVKMLDDSQTVHCNILAESGVITEADALQLAQVFDSANPFDPTAPGTIGLYDRITGICGHEWQNNPVGGRDGDLRVNLVICSASTMAIEGGFVFGLVRFADIFGTDIDPVSNAGEYVYINYEALAVPGGNPLQNYSLYGTLAHEFLHLVQMNAKVGEEGTFPHFDPQTPDPAHSAYTLSERRTMAEGFAETMATLCGYGVHKALDASPTGGADLLAYDPINLFLGGESLILPGMTGITTVGSNFWTPFLEEGDPYGIGHLFGLYLVDRYGAEKWGELTRSRHRGLLNLNAVLGLEPEDVFHGFNIALHASSLAGVPPQYDLSLLRPGGLNNYRPLLSDEPPIFHNLLTAGFVVSSEPTAWIEKVVPPWSTSLFRFIGGDGSALNLDIVLPLKSRASLIHESPAGTFSDIQ